MTWNRTAMLELATRVDGSFMVLSGPDVSSLTSRDMTLYSSVSYDPSDLVFIRFSTGRTIHFVRE
jgi:hypothetical protein